MCSDTITTRFLCCVSHNALLLKITFKKPFQNIFGNISIQWQCLGLSLSTIRYIYIWVSILRTFFTPSIRIGIFSISFILYYLIFCVSKNLFSGSAIYFIDQYLIVFSVYNEYIFTLTRALTGDFFFCHGYNGINGWTYLWKKTWHISVCMVLFPPRLSHCSSLWNSGTLTLVNNIIQ